jgi:glycosyltransferase involved in cell wall biosynthesis
VQELPLKVIISSGIGKLHFHETAKAAAVAGAEVEFIAGWIPQKRHARFVNALGRRLGETSLASRMQARRVEHSGVTMRSNAVAEFGGRAATALLRHVFPQGSLSGLAFAAAGKGSRKWLHDADIFHVRSGAGQGGAIRTARRNGMMVLADHSIAHPRYMDKILGEEYERLGLPFRRCSEDGLWTRVLRDCHEADRLLVNSNFVKRTFIEQGFRPDLIDVAYLGVSDRYFSVKNDYAIKGSIRLLFTGNFDIRKGIATLLQAVRLLRQRGADIRLRLVGNLANGSVCLRGSDAEFFEHIPFVPPEQLRSELSEADLFVFPTLVEGSSRSAMEAAAAGLPIITTENCGLPLEGEKEVVYVPLRDHDALASAIARLTNDEGLRSEIGRKAAAKIQRDFTWPLYGSHLMKVYSTLLS